MKLWSLNRDREKTETVELKHFKWANGSGRGVGGLIYNSNN